MNSENYFSYSIIICTYNSLESLKDTLSSINDLDITEKEKVELIIVDNNSNDGTKYFCQEFIKTSKLPSKYVFEPKQGLSNARNCGIEEAYGEILIFTDDDVVVPENWLVEYVKDFEQESPDCVFGRIIPDWKGEKPKWYDDSFSAVYGALDYGDKKFVVDSRQYEFYGANFAIRKDLLVELGGFDPKLGRTPDKLFISEERQVFLKLFELKKKFIYNPKIFLYHIISEKMKQKKYLEKYYYDTAFSLVYISDNNPKRQFIGIPYFRLYEFLRFYITFFPKMLALIFTGKFNKVFYLRLNLMRNNRMLCLYLKKITVSIMAG